jgi:hypothetical protein
LPSLHRFAQAAARRWGKNFFGAPERRVQNTIMMAKVGGEPMQSANAKNQCIFWPFSRQRYIRWEHCFFLSFLLHLNESITA